MTLVPAGRLALTLMAREPVIAKAAFGCAPEEEGTDKCAVVIDALKVIAGHSDGADECGEHAGTAVSLIKAWSDAQLFLFGRLDGQHHLEARYICLCQVLGL